MTEDSDFKHLVRERMASTGETYTAARAALRPDDPPAEVLIERMNHEPDDHSHAEHNMDADDEGSTPGGASMGDYLDVDPSLSADDLIALASLGISPSELAGLRTARPGCSLEDAISLHTMGVTTEVLVAWREIDPQLDMGDVLGAVSVGLTPQTFSAYRGRFPDLTIDAALGLHSVGVIPKVIDD